VKITGLVYNDANANMAPDVAESGIAGAPLAASGGLATVSAGNGSYTLFAPPARWLLRRPTWLAMCRPPRTCLIFPGVAGGTLLDHTDFGDFFGAKGAGHRLRRPECRWPVATRV